MRFGNELVCPSRMERTESSGTETKNLVFAVNGQRYELATVDPSITVLEFLRLQTHFKSVKLGCGEGGCGACVVLVSRYDPATDRVEDFTVSSCLTLLCSVSGYSITTTEGLGNSKDGFHPIHQRFSGFHASQCGYCTPGMCMSFYGALVNAEKDTNRAAPSPGFSKLTVAEAEKSISGNLCRCTGYRPIADACKSFAADVDIEDLGFNSFWRKGESRSEIISSLPPYCSNKHINTFPEFLKKEMKSAVPLDIERYKYPATIQELQCLLESEGTNSGVKLVVGNTGTGYYKESKCWDKYIDLRHIPELSTIRRDPTGTEIGAIVTISKAIEALKDLSDGISNSNSEVIYSRIADHMEKVATGFIRNSASVGGNLVMAQKEKFPSDIATLLLAADSVVNIMTSSKHETVALEEFLRRPPLDSKTLLLSVKIPTLQSKGSSSSETNRKLLFETYRAAPRPLGNALPYLNAAFLAEICQSADGLVIEHCRMAFGAFGTPHAIRVRKLEELLTGKILSWSLLNDAVEVVKETVVPEVGTSSAAYRTSLAVAFVFKFLSPLLESPPKSMHLNDFTTPASVRGFEETQHLATLSSSKQVVEIDNEYYPVGEPTPKAQSAIQASGEAVYVGDIPSPPSCLYGAFIYSTKPLAKVKSISFASTLPPGTVTSVISAKDIPEDGENVGSKTIFGTEALFADELVLCAGYRVALVVAETQKLADMAADAAVIDYDMDGLDPPILTVEEAVEKSSFIEVPPYFQPKDVGDFSKGMAEADHKIDSAQVHLGSQYYFYMENHTALAVPDEDNSFVVYSCTQCPEYAHSTIATCLGIPAHNVRVLTRRLGGGFGGKAVKAISVAAACAVAANKLRRPVRTYLNRKSDMINSGGRHPMKITYSVGFKSNGKITALRLDILMDAGYTADISPIMPNNMSGALKKYDWGALSFDFKVCKTNRTSRSAMRGPGDVQGSYVAEAVIEHVASALSMDVDAVRHINLHTYSTLKFFYPNCAGETEEYTVPSIWNKLGESSGLNKRAETIKQFNSCNTWKKRGISRVPVVMEVSLRATPGKVSIFSDGSVSVEVGGTELGQGLWTKVKQMVAFGLSSIHCEETTNLLDKVRVIQNDTLSLIQGGFTAGSTTSEASCEAAKRCCDTLVERLRPLRDRLVEQMGSVKWETLIQLAYMQSVDLSASTLYVPDLGSSYLNYGAAVSEVEVDLLTGQTSIIRSDIIYDCGKSLNPAIDLGQIEGAFVQGIGFFMYEEYSFDTEGLMVSKGTWTYKIPTLDTIPKEFNVEVLNSGHHKTRVLSSKASGEPPLLLAVSVHCAARAAIKEARKQILTWDNIDDLDSSFQLNVPAPMHVVKGLCGLDIVENYLKWRMVVGK